MQWPLLQMLWLGPAAQAGPPCPDEGVTLASVEALADMGARSFAEQDLSGLHQSRDNSLDAVPCLKEVMTPETAAALHRLLALGAFTEGDRDRARAELRVARGLQPEVALLDGLVLPGHPLARLYDAALTEGPEGTEIAPPTGRSLLIDGRSTSRLPADAAAVVQYLQGDAVSQTLLIQPGERLPEAAASGTSASLHRPILVSATSATAAAAVVVYSLSWQAHREFWDVEDDPIPDDGLEAQQQRINRRAGAAAVLGGGAGVLATLTVVYW